MEAPGTPRGVPGGTPGPGFPSAPPRHCPASDRQEPRWASGFQPPVYRRAAGRRRDVATRFGLAM